MENKRNILITGGAGFIGFALAKSLSKEKRNNVIIIDNLHRGNFDKEFKKLLLNKNVRFIKADITKNIQIGLNNLTHIFHLAGSVGVKNINKDSYGSFLNNIETLKNIVKLCKRSKKKIRTIIFSTSEVYSNLKKKKSNFPLKKPMTL